MADWVEYFATQTPPDHLKEIKSDVTDFATRHRSTGRYLVFLTSGGTRVPLEANAVRFIDNFSIGTRGAASAEYFLELGYAVIFLHRQGSLQPFTRHCPRGSVLDLLHLDETPDGPSRIEVSPCRVPQLRKLLKKQKEVKSAGTLLMVEFSMLSDFLFLLRGIAEVLAPHGPTVMSYLAAAVSDFYIPIQNMPEHKIPSDGPLQLFLVQTPKMMVPLVKEWIPGAFTVSFKLETDMNIISKKARAALAKYSHQVVVSNILQTRKKTVVIITPSQETAIWMSDAELEAGREIEEKIVAGLQKMHEEFIAASVIQGTTASAIVPNQASGNSNPIQSNNQAGQLFTGQTQVPPGSQDNVSSVYCSYSVPVSLGLASSAESPIQSRKGGESTPAPLTQSSMSEVSELPMSDEQMSTSDSMRFGALSDACLTTDMKAFIESFRARRIALGYTQEDVGNELSHTNGHSSYSQSFISRFESKNLGLKAAEKMKPVLQGWIEQKELECAKGLRMCKKRKRRTSFSSETLQCLIHTFEQNPKPTSADIVDISSKLGLEPVTVRVWFCNRKQMLKRVASGKSRMNNSLKAEIDAKKQEDQNNEKEPPKLDFTNMPVGQFSFTEDRVKALVCLTSEGSPPKSSHPTISNATVTYAQVHDDSIVHSSPVGPLGTIAHNTVHRETSLISQGSGRSLPFSSGKVQFPLRNGVAQYEAVGDVRMSDS